MDPSLFFSLAQRTLRGMRRCWRVGLGGASLSLVATLATASCVGDVTTVPHGVPDASLLDTSTAKDSASPTDTSAGGDVADVADAAPPPVTRVFVSSQKYYGDSLVGLDAADHDCQLLATAAGRGTGWRAWLSVSTTNAKEHVNLGSGSIMLVDGLTVVVAKGTDILTNGALLHAIDHDENSKAVAATLVWTGTTEKGLVTSGTCGDWAVQNATGVVGANNQTSATWSSDGFEPCTNSYPIYCFGP